MFRRFTYERPTGSFRRSSFDQNYFKAIYFSNDVFEFSRRCSNRLLANCPIKNSDLFEMKTGDFPRKIHVLVASGNLRGIDA